MGSEMCIRDRGSSAGSGERRSCVGVRPLVSKLDNEPDFAKEKRPNRQLQLLGQLP